MNFQKLLPLSLCALFLGHCATAYQSEGLFSGGFSDTQLSPEIFRVSFKGNGYTSSERVQDFALLRAAELCLNNGFAYFVVMNSENQSRVQTWNTDSKIETTGTQDKNTGHYQSTTTYSPGQTHTYYKPGIGLMVQGLKSKPQNPGAFDAAFLVKSVKSKYEIE